MIYSKADVEKEIKLVAEQKFELVHQTIEKYQLKRLVRYHCEIISVSRSGYYNYFTEKSAQKRAARDAEMKK
ncbi:hypothetical protein [Peribacillus simplex]|uniref:Transposase n=1 Tax=Peribacillus simplex TaxID=1478 RepID=A0AAW7IKX4_9BACI|nr:hypothetical protein [Peribacillus simplex]MDM5450808.1 hypothetical protein [Peribacillus simplex]